MARGTTTVKSTNEGAAKPKATAKMILAKKRRKATQIKSEAEEIVEAVKDPLECLPNECYDMVLTSLSPVDLVRCELVSQSWKNRVRSWMTLSGIRIHFPYMWETQSWDRTGPVPDQYKRLACQQRALKRGELGSVLRFPGAYHFMVAGDIAVWATENDDSINWQLLARSGEDRTIGETQTLDLQEVGRENRPVSLVDMHLNSDGFLLLRVQLGSSIYVPWEVRPPRSIRDVVYSLMDREIVMFQEYMDTDQEAPRDTPLLIGKHLVYFARETSSNQYDLIAIEFRTGALQYQKCIIAKIAAHDHGLLDRRSEDKVLELVQLDGKELIVQFDSRRLLSCSFCSPASFSIINGADGHVIQTISYDGFGGRRAVVTNSTTLALVGSPSYHECYHVVTIQKFSEQSDETFSRGTRQIVVMEKGSEYDCSILIHPFTMQAFSKLSGRSPEALTLAQSQDADISHEVDEMLQKLSFDIMVDSYYDVVKTQPLTLPPRQSNRGYSGRRKFKVNARWDYADMTLLDERRIVFDNFSSRGDAVYLFDFKPKW